MAYRRLPDGDVVATQVPLQAGATTLRQREILELIAFVVLLGAGLSLGLAFLVGRTLTSPMRTLQVASESVGGGNLKLQLPSDRADEFGSVFTAFNRMVLRLQRARRALVRTTRRTEAIVEDAATGVVALDAMGRVILVNARAQAVLEGRMQVGEPMPRFRGPEGRVCRVGRGGVCETGFAKLRSSFNGGTVAFGYAPVKSHGKSPGASSFPSRYHR